MGEPKTVCILAAGEGTRVNSYFHKALLPINNKAVISHIIEKFPIGSKFIVAVGHQAQEIAEYCRAAHSDCYRFEFVLIGNYRGEDSGPGVSLFACRQFLQQPFYITTADCLIEEEIPDLMENWIGVADTDNPQNYSTVSTVNRYVVGWKNKSIEGYKKAYIGLAHIQNFSHFWRVASVQVNSGSTENISFFYNQDMKAIDFTWHDTGTSTNYKLVKSRLEKERDVSLVKNTNEITYKVNNKCVKLCDDARDRVVRKTMIELTPELVLAGEKLIAYKWVEGVTMYEYAATASKQDISDTFLDVLDYIHAQAKNSGIPTTQTFKTATMAFYEEKTLARVKQFVDRTEFKHPQLSSCLDGIYWDNYPAFAIIYPFHGDLNFSNIIIDKDRNFTLIDWRANFNGQLYGDLYYDFAKLYAGLIISWDDIKAGRYSDGYVRPTILTNLLDVFKVWLHNRNYNLKHVVQLAYLTMMNMAPLHDEKFGRFLMARAIEGLVDLRDFTTKFIDY